MISTAEIEARWDLVEATTRDRRLNVTDLRCLALILYPFNEQWPSTSELQKKTGRSKRSVMRATAKLDRLGIIRKQAGGGTRRNTYFRVISRTT
jgi:predicted transcriptional regulator